MKFFFCNLVKIVLFLSFTAKAATQEDLQNEVWLGMNQDDWGRVLRAFDSGVQFAPDDDAGVEAMMFGKAISRYWAPGGSNVVVQLLKRGVPVDIKSEAGTPLQQALQESLGEEPAMLLLDHGAVKKLSPAERIETLFMAARAGCSNIVIRLLDIGVSVNATNSAGQTVLMWLIGTDPGPYSHGWPAYREPEIAGIAKALIARGADPEIKDQNGKTAADYAGDLGRYDLLHIFDPAGRLKSKYDVVKKLDAEKRLKSAIAARLFDLMQAINVPPPDSYDKVQIVHESLRAGADPNLADIPDYAPGAGTTIFGMALGAGGTANDWMHWSQWHQPIDIGIIEELVKAGAKVDEPLTNGFLPLTYAVVNPIAFKILLEAGADPRKVNQIKTIRISKSNPPQMIVTTNEEKIIETVAAFGSPDCMKLLLEHGLSAEQTDDSGSTLLHRAVDRGNLSMIEFLTKKWRGCFQNKL